MNRILQDYLDQVKPHLSGLPYAERDAVLREMRTHLEEDIQRRRAAKPDLSEDEAALQATMAFGEPSELGFNGPPGTIVRRSTGEVLLRVATLTGRAAVATGKAAVATGKAAGRGARAAVKWGAIAAAFLLVVAVVLVVAGAFIANDLAKTFQEEIKESIPRQVYGYEESWAAPALHNGARTDTFQVNDEVKEFHLSVKTDVSTGCAAVQLTSPSGEVVDVNGNGCESGEKATTYSEPGTWTVRYVFVAFTGSVQVSVVAYEDA